MKYNLENIEVSKAFLFSHFSQCSQGWKHKDGLSQGWKHKDGLSQKILKIN